MSHSLLADQANGFNQPSLRIVNDYGTTNGYGSYWNNSDMYANQDWMNNIGLNDVGNIDNNGVSSLLNLKKLDLMDKELGMQNKLLDQRNKYFGGWQYKYLRPAGQIMDIASSLGNLFLGYKQYGLAKQQMGLAKEKWNMTKDELNRIKNLRSALTKQYMGA